MDDQEDEDVVFEGSAIHQHLMDVGFTDFEQSKYLPPSIHGESQQDNTATGHKKFQSGWQKVQEHWYTVFPHPLFGTVANLLQQYIYVSVARAVFGSKLVSEDDWLVLEHFIPEGEELLTSAKMPFTWPNIVMYKDLGLVSMFLVLLWVVTGDWLVYFCVLLMAVALYTSYCIYLVWRSRSLKQFVMTLKETVYLTSKTVRLVQEVDLIAKGFVLAQGPGASVTTPYEVPPQITILSETLLSIVTSAAKVLLSVHTLLEERVPYHPTIRHLFDDSPPLEECCTFPERKQYLKDRVAVIKLQASAVLTKLVLLLSKPVGLSDYKAVSDVIVTSVKQDAFLDKLQFLSKQYEYNKCFWLTERSSMNESQCLEEKKKNVYLAIHSLALHLQAALVRVQSLEAKFERESDVSKLCDTESLPPFPSYEHVKEQITALRLEVDSCQGCIEEAEARAERKYGITDKSDEKEAHQTKSTTEGEHVETAEVTKPPLVLLYDQEVPPAEDEVFEAYIDQEYLQEDRSTWEDKPWCTDARKERQVFRQQKEQGKRVLKELQPILSSRRKMWEKREKIALEKHDRKGETVKSSPVSKEHADKNMREESFGRKNNTSNSTSPSVECTASCSPVGEEEDSDEERLRIYRKVKKELDEDEEKRAAVLMGGEEDSDEERLRTYKKIKNELYEDEENTLPKARLGGGIVNSDQGLRSLQSLIRNSRESTVNYSNSDSGVDKSKVIRLSLVQDLEQFPVTQQSSKDVKDKSTSEVNIIPENSCSQSEVFSTDEQENDEEALREEYTTPKDETFTHNEDTDDDESRKIDWTTFTLPMQQTDTLDDRLQLFSGGACLGFTAEVAAQASAASRSFWKTAKCPEETFGGVGEGEVFGSDSEQEKDSDSDADEH